MAGQREPENISPKPGEQVRIPRKGPDNPREFTADEKQSVTTILDFELPFAVEGLQGSLPLTMERADVFQQFPGASEGYVMLMTRQRSPEDIRLSLGLSSLKPPSKGVIVAFGDRCGRVNISMLRFAFAGFVELDRRDELFDACIKWTSSFIERYRRETGSHRLPKVLREDIVLYRIAHVLADVEYNNCIEPVANLSLRALSGFPNDPILYARMIVGGMRPDLWRRLLDEARHCAAVHDYRICVLNTVIALEVVLKEDNNQHLEDFLGPHDIPFDRFRHADIRDSLKGCLNLLHMFAEMTGLPEGLTERVLERHVRRRDNIVHGPKPQMRVSPEDARQCIEDVDLLIRYLVDEIHFSLTARLELAQLPPPEAAFDLVRMRSAELTCDLRCEGTRVAATLESGDSTSYTLSVDLSDVEWKEGNLGTLAVTYDAHASMARLIYNTIEVDSVSPCELGAVDASRLEPQPADAEHVQYLPVKYLLTHSRVIEPHQLEDVDGVFQSPKEYEQS